MEFWRDRRVLELGSGCGLGGIAAAALGAEVVLTDIVTQQAEHNVRETFRNTGVVLPRVQRLRWGEAGDIEAAGKDGPFDVILGGDVLYNKEVR